MRKIRLGMLLLLFLPVFGNGADTPSSVSLFQITGIQPWLKTVFVVAIGLMALNGIFGVILARYEKPVWEKRQLVTGIGLSSRPWAFLSAHGSRTPESSVLRSWSLKPG